MNSPSTAASVVSVVPRQKCTLRVDVWGRVVRAGLR